MSNDELRKNAPARLNANQAGAILGAGRSTIYRWAEDGKLPGALKINGLLRIDRDTLLDHLEQLIEAA